MPKINNTGKRIFLFAFLEHTSINLMIPLLTLIFFDIHFSLFPLDTSLAIRSFWYGLATATYQVGGVIGSPLLGYISDYYGRGIVLKICGVGVLLSALLGMGSLFFCSITLILMSRLMGGACLSNAVGQAAISDLSTNQNKMMQMGYFQSTIALGAFLGPLLSAFFMRPFFSEKLHLFSPFMISFLIGLLGFYILFKPLQNKSLLTVNQKPFSWKNIKNLISNHNIIKISLGLLLNQLSWSLYYQYITPLLKQQFSTDASHICLFFSLIAAYIILGSSIGLNLIKRYIFSTQKIVLLGSLIMLAGLLLNCSGIHLNQVYLIWFSAFFIGIGDVIIFSAFVTLYSDAVSSHQQGAVMGICLIIRQLAWTLTGIFGGIAFGIFPALPLIISPLSISLLILLLIFSQHLFFGNTVNEQYAKLAK